MPMSDKHPNPGNNPNVGPKPVDAEPNHDREKTYEAPSTPKPYKDAQKNMPERTAEETVREEMPAAVDAVKSRVQPATK